MERIGSPETSVLNRLTPRNNPESGKIHFNSGVSLKLPHSFINIYQRFGGHDVPSLLKKEEVYFPETSVAA
jgi:hypothetical protein